MNSVKKNSVEVKKPVSVATGGYGRGKFFSGKRKKNAGIAKCNTSCSGSCK